MPTKMLNIICFMVIFIPCIYSFPGLKIQRLNKEHFGQRLPLYSPERCDENELLFPAEKLDEWICDCGPGFIYHPEKEACFAAFRQGPCEKGHHLILNASEKSPTCVLNPCNEGFAIFKNDCYELGTPGGPCPSIQEGGGIFDVNATTLEVECLTGTDPLSLFSSPTRCSPGSKRDRNGNCRIIYD